MAGEWTKAKLAAFLKFANGKASPERYDDLPYPVYGSNGIIGFANDKNSEENTIIIGRVGSYCGSLYFSKEACWVTDNAIRATALGNNSPRFFYYFLSGLGLNQWRGGSGQPLLNQSTLSIIPVYIPPPDEQRAIAHILGTLDDKIELNRRMNQTLEQIAQAIFKSWFIDATQNGLPEGWRVGKFGDCCNIKGGYAYKSKDFKENGYPLVRIKNINSDHTVDLFDVVHVPEEIAYETKDFWLNDGDLVMAMTGATIGKFGLIVNRSDTVNAVLNQRVAKIIPKNKSIKKPWFQFVSLLVTDIYEQVVNIGGGSAQPNISSTQIESCRFIVPDDNSIMSFTNSINPVMEKWIINIKQSRTLAALRDALLPKLISGELRVKDAERFLKEIRTC